MNYIKQINALNRLWDEGVLTTNEVLVMFCLLDINNQCNWIEWFTVANSTLSKRTKVKDTNLVRIRKRLEEKGLIACQKNKGRQAPGYKLIPLYEENIPNKSEKARLSCETNDKQNDNQMINKMINKTDNEECCHINDTDTLDETNNETNDNHNDNQTIINGITLNKHINKTTKLNTNIININKLNNINNISDLPPVEKTQDEQFEELWSEYPRPEGEMIAKKSFLKSLRNGATFEEIYLGLKRYKEKLQATNTDYEYIKSGEKFFSEERWRDKHEIPIKQKGSSIIMRPIKVDTKVPTVNWLRK